MCRRLTKKDSDKGAGVRVRDGGEEGVPLRVVNGASGLRPRRVRVGSKGNEANPRGFLYKEDVSKCGFKDSRKVGMTLSHINGENSKVFRH